MTHKELKRKKRRLTYLCTEVGITDRTGTLAWIYKDTPPFSIDKELETFDKDFVPTSYNEMIGNRIELLKLFKELEFTDAEAYTFWVKIYYERWRERRKYNGKPIPVRKDNPNLYGEEFKGYGTPRQPRRVRKTAWKRFEKLFPNYKAK